MRIIGVTGGIGSGKTTVSRILEAEGAIVIDADDIARQMLKKDGAAYWDVVRTFGDGIKDDSGEIDRKKLGGMVFGDSQKLSLLNELTHSHVANKIIELVEWEKKSGMNDVVVLDVPIPVKHGFIDVADEIWVVVAPLETRIERIMKRNSLTRNEALQRINSQMSQEEYIRLADKVIINDGSIEKLKNIVIELLRNKN